MASLQGRHALVTGGGRGIGRAIAAALTAAGATVTVVGRSEDALKETVGKGDASGYAVADVTDAARTPEPIVARIRREVVETIGTSAIRDKLAAQLMEPVGSTPEEFRARIEAEISRWEPVIRSADIKVN